MDQDFTLAPEWRESIRKAAASVHGSGPLTVVVASDPYATLVDNWLCHMEELGLTRILVVAMDDRLAQRLEAARIPWARCSFDGSEEDFWLRRMMVWDCLLREGLEIIQSDIDALWLKNPIPEYFDDPPFDMAWSQGTIHPPSVLGVWGFVLCAGLFWARPSAGTLSFFGALIDHSARIRATDDQLVINELLRDRGMTWNYPESGAEKLHCRGSDLTTYPDLLIGHCEAFDLRVAMLPHRLFPRLADAAAGPYVKHVLRGADPAQRITELRDANCWILDRRGGVLGR